MVNLLRYKASALILATAHLVAASKNKYADRSLPQEDIGYWTRVLEEVSSLDSQETAAPSTSLTSEGSLSFGGKATVAPVLGSCSMDIEVACSTDDGIDCNEIQGRSTDCEMNIGWTVSVTNTGEHNLTVHDVDFATRNATFALSGDISPNEVMAGETATSIVYETINACAPNNFASTATVTGSSAALTDPCSGTDSYEFSLGDACQIVMDLDCVVVADDTSCSTLMGEQEPECVCSTCPRQMVFRYTGAGNLSTSHLSLKSEDGDEYYSGVVNVGDDITILGQRCVPPLLDAIFSDAETMNQMEKYQIDSSCDGPGLTLMDSQGPLDFVGYTCLDDGVVHSCYTDVQYSLTVVNGGVFDIQIDMLDTAVNSQLIDLTKGIPETELALAGGETYAATFEFEVGLCTSSVYEATSAVSASYLSTGAPRCSEAESFDFSVTAGTPSPTTSPTTPPTGSPTLQTSSVPTTAKTTAPTHAPTKSPTIEPTSTPTMSPTPEPTSANTLPPTTTLTKEPTLSPTELPTLAPTSAPTATHSSTPTISPTQSPTPSPTSSPTIMPTAVSSATPTVGPTPAPTNAPTTAPTTATPTSVPTVSTPVPSTPPGDCQFEAMITCELASGQSCTLQSPMGTVCSEGKASLLQFMYTPDATCTGDNEATNFACEDYNVSASRPDSVLIQVSSNGTTLFTGDSRKGQVFDIATDGADAVDIEISTTDGMLLQASTVSTSCTEESALELLRTFGNLQLVGFENESQGVQQVFSDVTISYTVANVGLLDIEVSGAFINSPFSGFQDLLTSSATLVVDDSKTFKEEFMLNLATAEDTTFQFAFLAQGSTSSQETCYGTHAYALTVGSS
eukprot:Nitzschia sp. Nitz4//scaffold3_size479765//192559//195108//NITZ4_000079-RA/size479765-processed-gene-1.438-mRNA-1//1//CDS//3329550695//4468//frame0